MMPGVIFPIPIPTKIWCVPFGVDP